MSTGMCDAVAFHARSAAARTDSSPPAIVNTMIQLKVDMEGADCNGLTRAPDQRGKASRVFVAAIGIKTRWIGIRAKTAVINVVHTGAHERAPREQWKIDEPFPG